MIALIFLLSLTVPPATAWPASPRTHIRPMDRMTEAVVADAARRSPTVAQLISQLEEHDVVVYIGSGTGLRARGLLYFLGYGEPMTYLRMSIELRQLAADRIAAIAHELTHALEIAESPTPIRGEADLLQLYTRIGWPGPRNGDVESERARIIEARARSEAVRGTTRWPG
jgi:hypothetical protein